MTFVMTRLHEYKTEEKTRDVILCIHIYISNNYCRQVRQFTSLILLNYTTVLIIIREDGYENNKRIIYILDQKLWEPQFKLLLFSKFSVYEWKPLSHIYPSKTINSR